MALFESNIHKQSDKVSLSASERHDLRARLATYIEYHPLPIRIQRHALVSLPSFLSSLAARVSAVSMVTIITLTIIPFIAEQSDPGDTLYAIKSGFNESVREQLVTTPYEKITFETERLERRMAEVRLLVEEGNLDDATEHKLTKSIIKHSESVQAGIDELRTTDAESAELAQIGLAATVTANEAVVTAIDAISSPGNTDAENTPINNLKNAVASIRETTESKTASSTQKSPDRVIALVEQETTRAMELRNSVESSLSDTEKADVEKLFESLRLDIATLSLTEEENTEKVAAAKQTSSETVVALKTTSFAQVAPTTESATTTEVAVKQKPTPTQILTKIKKLILFLNDINLRTKVDIKQEIEPVVVTPESTETKGTPAETPTTGTSTTQSGVQ